MSEDALTLIVELTRGRSTYDCDTLRAHVTAEDVEELDRAAEQIRDRLERLAEDLRGVQPTGASSRSIADDQSRLDVEGDA